MNFELPDISSEQLTCCLLLALADRYSGTIRGGSSNTFSEDINSVYDIKIDTNLIASAAKILESTDISILSGELKDDPWISIDSNHFHTIFRSRKNSNTTREIRNLFQSYPTLKSYAEFGSDWLDHVVGCFKKNGIARFPYDTNDQFPISVPASDRIVELTDNQQNELEKSTTDLIDAVEQQNGIEGDLTLRQKIVGQLKAGRELIRAQIFSAELMRLIMIDALKSLINKYEGHVIGAAAATLMELLIKHIGGMG